MEFRSYQLRLRITALPPGTAEENPAVAEQATSRKKAQEIPADGAFNEIRQQLQ
jgi:hypothetical protein